MLDKMLAYLSNIWNQPMRAYQLFIHQWRSYSVRSDRPIENELVSNRCTLHFKQLHTLRYFTAIWWTKTATSLVIERYIARINYPTFATILKKIVKLSTPTRPHHKIAAPYKITTKHTDSVKFRIRTIEFSIHLQLAHTENIAE